jgi:6-phosphogluconolactonase
MSERAYRIEVLPDKRSLARAAANLFARCSREALGRGDRFTVALSGGSTPAELYRLLAADDEIRDQVDWQRVHLFWGDERFVPADDADSNYRMVRLALLENVPIPADNVHHISTEFATAQQAADAYARQLQSFFGLAPGDFPRFDLVLLGMGTDGHTASLFPGVEAIREKQRLVAAPWVAKFQAFRITMTPPVLNNGVLISFLVSGEEKADRLKEVLYGPRDIDRLPSQVIEPTAGRLLWLVDQGAASNLDDRDLAQQAGSPP